MFKKREIKLFIIDMLCLTPYYDKYLVEAINKKTKILALCLYFSIEQLCSL